MPRRHHASQASGQGRPRVGLCRSVPDAMKRQLVRETIWWLATSPAEFAYVHCDSGMLLSIQAFHAAPAHDRECMIWQTFKVRLAI